MRGWRLLCAWGEGLREAAWVGPAEGREGGGRPPAERQVGAAGGPAWPVGAGSPRLLQSHPFSAARLGSLLPPPPPRVGRTSIFPAEPPLILSSREQNRTALVTGGCPGPAKISPRRAKEGLAPRPGLGSRRAPRCPCPGGIREGRALFRPSGSSHRPGPLLKVTRRVSEGCAHRLCPPSPPPSHPIPARHSLAPY